MTDASVWFDAAMYGTVMRGMPHHDRIAGARFQRDGHTAPRYRLLAVDGAYPLMVEDESAGAAIAVQVFRVTDAMWRGKVDREPEGLREGTAVLDDGAKVAVMLGDPDWLAARAEVQDITSFGGWANYVRNGGR